MRKTQHFMGLTLLAAAVLISCSREALPETVTPADTPEVTPVETEKPTIHTIHIKADGDDTRTQIVGTSSLWSEGDRLFVYQGYAYGKDGWFQEAKASRPGEMINGGAQMSFEVDFDYVDPDDVEPCWTENDEPFNFLYQAVYPAENTMFFEEEGANFLVVNLPDRQYPTPTSFDPKSDILTSRPTFLMQQPDELNLSFKRQTALVQMTLKGLPEGAPVEMVAFFPYSNATESSPFREVFVLDPSSGNELGWFTDGKGGVYLYTPEWTVPAAEGGNPTALMTSFMCNPFSLGEGDMFEVVAISKAQVTDEDTGEQHETLLAYVKDVALGEGRELVFTAGDLTSFGVNMSGIEPMAIPVFELMFDEYTQEDFPHITDEKDPYIEIPYVVDDDSGSVWISFNANHPWTVSFSEPWLYTRSGEGNPGYGEFRIFADSNDTGSSREATMTISSQFYGDVKVRVVQEAMVLPDFELVFDAETREIYPELAEGRLDLPFLVGGGGGGGPKKAKVGPGDYINLSFEISHPWTVRFSESWLSADPSSGNASYRDEDGDVYYRWFNLYATPNYTGTSREATMTIASRYFGEVNIRVVQEAMVLPNSISFDAPSTVTAYSCFDVDAFLGYPDGVDRGYRLCLDPVEGQSNIQSIVNGYLAVNPGTVTFRAYLSHDDYPFLDEDFTLESEVVVTITEGSAPTDWYFATNRPYGAYLTHITGNQHSSVALSTLRTAVVKDLAFSADRTKIYAVGSVVLTIDVDEEREEPRLWTYDCATGTVHVTELDYPSGRGKKVAVDENTGDVYVLVDASSEDISNRYCLLKNNENIWETSMYYVISDLTVENGNFYLCGNTEFRNFANGTDPIVWKNDSMMLLQEYEPSSNRIQPYFEPKAICVLNGMPYTVGLMPVLNNEWYYFEYSIMWKNKNYMYIPTLRIDIDGLRQIPHDMVLLTGEGFHPEFPPILVVGEQRRSSTENITPGLYLDRPFNSSNLLPLNYSGSASIQSIRLFNGIPALLGMNDGRTAYWSAPWNTPTTLSLNEGETVVGFLVK